MWSIDKCSLWCLSWTITRGLKQSITNTCHKSFERQKCCTTSGECQSNESKPKHKERSGYIWCGEKARRKTSRNQQTQVIYGIESLNLTKDLLVEEAEGFHQCSSTTVFLWICLYFVWVKTAFPNSYHKLLQLPSPWRFHGGSQHSICIPQRRVRNWRYLSPRCRLLPSCKASQRVPDHPWSTWKCWDEELLPGRISVVL